jgi:hypothetical protein
MAGQGRNTTLSTVDRRSTRYRAPLLTGSSSTVAPRSGDITRPPPSRVAGTAAPGRHSAPRRQTGQAAWRPERAVTLAHIASLVGAFAFWAWSDRGLWFFGDEWNFLVGRGLSYAPTNPESIWFPHNEHWSTLPVLLWRATYSLFHLSTYWPYLVPVLVAQVVVMHLAWRVSLRAGADPWVATAAAAVLGFLGAGAEDLAWAFQIGFVGSVMFGLVALDLMDRPAADRRNGLLVWASLALLASLMCSTIGDAMVVGAAVLAFARFPWRRAVAVLALPVVAYVTWFAGVGHLGLTAHSDRFTPGTIAALPRYTWDGLSWALGRASNLQVAGPVVLVALIAWVAWHFLTAWRERPVLLALCAATLAFYLLAGLGRDISTGTPDVSRYVYVAIALLTPVIATALSAPRAPAVLRLGAIAILAITLIGNVGQAQTWVKARVALTSRLKTEVLTIGRLTAAGVPDVSGPNAAPISYFPNLSASGLALLQRSHLLPAAALTRADMVNGRALLAVGDWNGDNTTLLPKPLIAGHFQYLTQRNGTVVRLGDRCFSFSPARSGLPLQIWLRIPAAEAEAAVLVMAPPAPAGVSRYVAAVLVPRRGPSSTVPVELVVPPSGTGYLSDDAARAKLVLTWTEGSTLKLCGLSAPA